MMLEILLLVWKTQKYGGVKRLMKSQSLLLTIGSPTAIHIQCTSINKRFKKNKHRFTSTQNVCLFTLYCCFCKHE